MSWTDERAKKSCENLLSQQCSEHISLDLGIEDEKKNNTNKAISAWRAAMFKCSLAESE